MRTLLLLIAMMATAEAQAPSFLAMCSKSWNCENTQHIFEGRKSIQLSWLSNTFGADCPCVKTMLADPRKKTVRVHLANSPCMRNKRCGRYEVFYGMNKVTASRAVIKGRRSVTKYFDRELNKLSEMFAGAKNLQCFVSPCLECDLNEDARRVLLNRISVALPDCIPVDNPHAQRCINGYVCESHGANPKASSPCIVDMDGTDGRTLDLKRWVERYRHCELAFYWEPYMNCIRGSFVDPRQRNCSYKKQLFTKTKGIICRSFLRPLFDTCSH